MTTKCRCHPESPFLWRTHPQPSIFAKALAVSSVASKVATAHVEAQRALGKEVGTIEGLSKNGADAILRFRKASVYTRAKRSTP